jgi:hypothetical protein
MSPSSTGFIRAARSPRPLVGDVSRKFVECIAKEALDRIGIFETCLDASRTTRLTASQNVAVELGGEAGERYHRSMTSADRIARFYVELTGINPPAYIT